MAIAPGAVHIEGLRELQAALRKMDGNSQKQLRVVLNNVVELVATTARSRVPHRSGRAAGSIKPQSSQREARVVAGGGVPYYFWLDFGGTVGRGKRGAGTGPIRRANVGKDGRYLYAAYRDRRATVREELSKGLQELITSSGLEAS